MAMAAAAFVFKAVGLLLLIAATISGGAAATWCVVRSDASETVMQRALDFACSSGADCAPIQPSGLCYLPNTLPAHASYAINSYYQRRRNAPDACSFGGAAATATTDPSYGSCMYPSSPSNAGGTLGTSGGMSTPAGPTMREAPPPPLGTGTTPLYGGGGVGNAVADSPTSNASLNLLKRSIGITRVIFGFWSYLYPK